MTLALKDLKSYDPKKRIWRSSIPLPKHMFKGMYIDYPAAPYHGVRIKKLLKFSKQHLALSIQTYASTTLLVSPEINLSPTPPTATYDPDLPYTPITEIEQVFRKAKLHYLQKLQPNYRLAKVETFYFRDIVATGSRHQITTTERNLNSEENADRMWYYNMSEVQSAP